MCPSFLPLLPLADLGGLFISSSTSHRTCPRIPAVLIPLITHDPSLRVCTTIVLCRADPSADTTATSSRLRCRRIKSASIPCTPTPSLWSFPSRDRNALARPCDDERLARPCCWLVSPCRLDTLEELEDVCAYRASSPLRRASCDAQCARFLAHSAPICWSGTHVPCSLMEGQTQLVIHVPFEYEESFRNCQDTFTDGGLVSRALMKSHGLREVE